MEIWNLGIQKNRMQCSSYGFGVLCQSLTSYIKYENPQNNIDLHEYFKKNMALGWRSEGHGFQSMQEPPGNLWPLIAPKKISAR